jgi:rubrerythrin
LVVTPPAPCAATTSRRRLLGGSGAGLVAGAFVLAGCSHKSHRPDVHKIPPHVRAKDVEILNRALDLEHKAIAAYTAGIPLLGGSAHDAAKQFLGQELSHAGELSGLIKQAGGKANKPKASYDLGRPRNRTDVLRLLHELERAEIAVYLAAIPDVSPGSVRAAVAAILGNDAQHVVILRAALGLEPIPSAFVTGGE